jgi:maltose alpha-D-glucosyltransferase / alpha-amylase
MLDVVPLARHRPRRVPPRRRALPLRARRHQRREPPETHEFLRRVRKEVDDEYPGKVLLAEANQWPEDVVEYFGDGDECHMCFHFPLMPRMFMALRREERHPITRSSRRPRDPRGCQWGIFLRNHDELTLEMVTDEERDYMYAEYAKDPRMRRNIGISRRLFPLLENDRRQAELLHALLFSCRARRSCTTATRSAWATTSTSATATASAPRCSGRPTATAGSPRPTSPSSTCRRSWTPCTASAVNVEAERATPSSFLHWIRRALQIRKQHPVFGTGSFEPLHAENPSVLAYLRTDARDTVLCVNNLSRFPQPCELMLEHLAGKVPVELTGRVPFPPIGELPYFVTLAPYGFYWFQLQDPVEEVGEP